jgi:CubicO group peptidase (beta-lactamase class C family)
MVAEQEGRRMAGTGSLEAAAERLAGFARDRLGVPGLAVGLVGPGGWRHELAVGAADVASGRPLAPDALVPVASVGKAMTAVALLREHDAGRLGLDDPVHDHLPWLPLATPFGPISLRHLLGHTAGIIAGMEGSPSPVVEALALAETPPGCPPGERTSYSNVGYAVLGLVLERVAGCSYAEAIRRHVLEPCAMTGSEAVTTAGAQARAPTGHLRLPGGALVPAPWVPTAAGSGATLCTAADLGRFLRAVVAGDPPLLAPATRQAMLTLARPLPEGERYGYGLGVELDTEAGYRRVGHQGDCPGFCAYAYGCLETGVGVVALGNGPWRPPGDPASPWAVVDHGLALLRAAALGLAPPPDPPAPDPDPEPEPEPDRAAPAGALPGELAALVGTYAAFNPWIPQVRVRPAAAGGLVLVWPEGDEEPMTALEYGAFRLGDDPASPERVRFRAVVDGRPMQAVVSGWPFDRVD